MLALLAGTLIQWARRGPFQPCSPSESCARWQDQEQVQTCAGMCHLSLSEPLLQAGSSGHSSQEQRPRAKHFLITAYRASFCVGVDNGHSAKHRQFLPACSELMPGIHPCLTKGPIAIGGDQRRGKHSRQGPTHSANG